MNDLDTIDMAEELAQAWTEVADSEARANELQSKLDLMTDEFTKISINYARLLRLTKLPVSAREAAVMELVLLELLDARLNHPAMHSRHEGYAVLKEEVDELWTEVKSNASIERVRDEAKQVAAMGMRFLLDLCDVA